jgi:hypothetical protein
LGRYRKLDSNSIINGLVIAKKDEYLEIDREKDIIHPFSERFERIKDAL